MSRFLGSVSRRVFLSSVALAQLSGCAEPAPPRTMRSRGPNIEAQFAVLEKKYDARLGLFALDSRAGSSVAYQADDRFAYCSTFKAFAAAEILSKLSISELDRVIRYRRQDLVNYSPITGKSVGIGLTIRELCEAAVCYSDNTAANLLLKELGGPAGLNSRLRNMGDTVTKMTNYETALNRALPGDVNDTSTARALARNLYQYVLGTALPAEKQALLWDWLHRNTTGDKLIRAGTPQGWRVGDKTGAGGFATRNDIGIIYPLAGPPISIAVLSSRADKAATYHDKLIADATRLALNCLIR